MTRAASVRRASPQLRKFLSAYDPAVGRLFLAARAVVLEAAPEAMELVYDAYNAVAAAYSFSDRLKEAFCHVAAYPAHVNLGFNRGATLSDPQRLLRGSGARIRHVKVAAAADLAQPGVRALVRAAAAEGRALVAEPGKPGVVIKDLGYTRKRRPG